MSHVSSTPAGGGGRGSSGLDFDLNLAPVIDCFVVLITFLLASASFLSIGLLDAGVAAGAASTSETQPPPVQITLELKADKSLLVKVSGKSTNTLNVPAKGGERDYAGMAKQLEGLKGSWPQVTGATLIADPAVEYAEVIATMEAARKTHPAVLLGGF